MRLTRRTLLAASAAFLAACSGKKHAASRSVPPPDSGAMAAAYLDEEAFIAAYDRALALASAADQAHLVVERAVHATHLAALKAFKPTAAAAPQAPHYRLATIARTLRASATFGRRAAVNAVDGGNAALLASIAASHATSAESQR